MLPHWCARKHLDQWGECLFYRWTIRALQDKLSRRWQRLFANPVTLAMKMVMTFSKIPYRPRITALALAAAVSLLGGCDSANTEYAYPQRYGDKVYAPGEAPPQSVFGKEGIDLFGQSKKGADQGGQGLGINSFLWRASLDTISFMPIASADPFGGVIITDWYAPPESPDERFKLNVFIMGRALRADGLKIAAFRQAKDSSGNWADRPVDPAVITDLENTVLTRARKMRIAAQSGAAN